MELLCTSLQKYTDQSRRRKQGGGLGLRRYSDLKQSLFFLGFMSVTTINIFLSTCFVKKVIETELC